MTRRYCFVATGYLVRDAKTLLLKHKKLGMWLPPGGHIEEELGLPHVPEEVRVSGRDAIRLVDAAPEMSSSPTEKALTSEGK